MNQNHTFADTALGLPEDIRHLKEYGDFENAIRLIDLRLENEALPQCMRRNYEAQKEILRRMPGLYPYTKASALDRIRQDIPDFTMEELEHYIDLGRVTWHYIHGELRLLRSFFGTLRKTQPEFAARLPQQAPQAGASHELLDRNARLDRAARLMQEKGSMRARIRVRAQIAIADDAFVPGETYRVWLPIPAACIQQSEIRLLDFSSQPTFIAPEDAAQRTVYWEETMVKNHPFWVEYSYLHTAPFADPAARPADPVQPTFFTGETAPHIVFTPYIRALCAELSAGTDDPVEKARRFYDYVTQQVKYSFAPDYFTLPDIAETCLKTCRGDCGIQALAFVTLCRCAGIPAKWQSGLEVDPDSIGQHDWAMFYIAPFGWMFADPSFGGSAWRAGNLARHNHYFGNLDVYRCVTVNGFQQDFEPASRFWRADPYDNQLGEVECSTRSLLPRELDYNLKVVDFQEI